MSINNIPTKREIFALEIMAGLASTAPKVITPKVKEQLVNKAIELGDALLNKLES
jgi:hypothetical protein